jgi:alkanesulfonate monooxygenase SsuD/methylene tetrahydromethanopterin reductase-like flavin-dependent oxidoreductase (luciferase family)
VIVLGELGVPGVLSREQPGGQRYPGDDADLSRVTERDAPGATDQATVPREAWPSWERYTNGYVADSKKQAIELSYPYFQSAMSAFLNAPFSALPTKQHYGADASLQGALVAGSPEEVAEKILFQQSIFGNARFLMQISVGTMPHNVVMRSIELLGTRVAPIVRAGSLVSAA